jgi:hypothetical protein
VFAPVAFMLAVLCCGCRKSTTTSSAVDRRGGAPTIKGSALALAPVDKYALLVGIEHYPFSKDDLAGPASDVRALYSLLIHSYGYLPQHIDTLIDRSANRDSILGLLQHKFADQGQNTSLLIYFSGHGMRLDKNYSVQEVEASGVDQALKVWGSDGKSTIILDDELGHVLHRLHAGHVLVVVDACFSGSIDRFYVGAVGKRPRIQVKRVEMKEGDPSFVMPSHFLSDGDSPSEYDTLPTSDPGSELRDIASHALIAASAEDMPAVTLPDWPVVGQSRGEFSYYLQQALLAQDGDITPRKLAPIIQSSIKLDPNCPRWRACQVPQAAGSEVDQPIRAFLGDRMASRIAERAPK